MKRFALGVGLLAAAVAALPLVRAEDPACAKDPYHCTGACTRGCPATGTSSSSDTCPYTGQAVTESVPAQTIEHKPAAGVVDDLVAVLAETKSKDVYTAAVVALAHLGTDARPALSDILKNAERLGVLEGAFAAGGCKSIQCEVILDAVAAIAHGPDASNHGSHHGYAACPYHRKAGTDCVLPYPRPMESCDESSHCTQGQCPGKDHESTSSSESDGLDR